MATDYSSLPPDLPVPEDDGAADHLTGMTLPPLALAVAGGDRSFDLREAAAIGTLVAFVYPRTGTPGQPLVPGWDDIPGARGCTPQSCAFRDRHLALAGLGALVVGISAMDPREQGAFAEREQLPYALLNDGPLKLRDELGLPTFDVHGTTALQAPDVRGPSRPDREGLLPRLPPRPQRGRGRVVAARGAYLKCGRPFGPASFLM